MIFQLPDMFVSSIYKKSHLFLLLWSLNRIHTVSKVKIVSEVSSATGSDRAPHRQAPDVLFMFSGTTRPRPETTSRCSSADPRRGLKHLGPLIAAPSGCLHSFARSPAGSPRRRLSAGGPQEVKALASSWDPG